MASLSRSLNLGQGITLAIGSIMGSGILFLPSLTYSIAGNDISVVWLAATIICIPLLLFFPEW